MYCKQFSQQGHLMEIYSGPANGTEGCGWQPAWGNKKVQRGADGKRRHYCKGKMWGGGKSHHKAEVNSSRGRRVGFQSISSTSSHLGLKREWGVEGFVASGDEHENRFPLIALPASVNTHDSCIAGGWKTDVIERGWGEGVGRARPRRNREAREGNIFLQHKRGNWM